MCFIIPLLRWLHWSGVMTTRQKTKDCKWIRRDGITQAYAEAVRDCRIRVGRLTVWWHARLANCMYINMRYLNLFLKLWYDVDARVNTFIPRHSMWIKRKLIRSPENIKWSFHNSKSEDNNSLWTRHKSEGGNNNRHKVTSQREF